MKSIVAKIVHIVGMTTGLALFSLVASAQKPSVAFKSDSSHMLIGDHLKIQMEARQQPDDYLMLGDPEHLFPKNFELLKAGKLDTVKSKDGFLQLNQELTLTSFDTGVFVIPRGKVYYTENESKDSIKAQGFTIRVSTVSVDTSKAIKDIKSPYEAPLSFAEIWPYLLGLILILGLAYLIYRFLQQRKRR